MDHFNVEVFDEGSATIVCAVGSLDVSSTVKFQRSLASMMRTGGSVVVDLDRLTFIDSSGLSSLAKGRRAAEQVGCQFKVRGAHGAVADVLERTGLGEWLRDGNEGAGSA